MNKIILAGGGTLGSVSPLIAIAEQFPEADYLFITTRKGPEVQFLRTRNFRTLGISAGKFRRYFSWRNVTDIFKFISGFIRCLIIIQQYRPDVILTAGGYVAVPVVFAGRLLGKKIFVHQQDLELGLANKLMAPLATHITVAFPELTKLWPSKKTLITGNPARQLNLPATSTEQGILILGGSQGARPMNAFLNTIIPELTKKYPVYHVLGANNLGQKLNIKNNYQAFGFIDKELPELLGRSGVVITRGGISTLTEMGAISRPCIIIPIPKSHQEANADFFEAKKAAKVVKQGDGAALISAIDELMTDSVYRQTLSRNLANIFIPTAAADYVRLIKAHMSLAVDARPAVYLAGIGGVGVSALANYFLHNGYTVIGSDIMRNSLCERLEQHGVKIHYQQQKSNLPANLSLFVYSSALPVNNEEITEAKRRHIPTYTYNEYLGVLSQNYQTIAITGTHGKTTVTGLVGYILTEANLDPTVVVGGIIPQFDGGYRAGKSKYFVVEACEYRSHMLLISPWIIALNNIDEDHLDYYRDLDHIQSQFQLFVDKLPADGALVMNLDDVNSKIIKNSRETITVAIDKPADYRATEIEVGNQRQTFDLLDHGVSVGSFSLRIPGKFNIYNSLMAIAIARKLGISYDVIRTCLLEYRGSWRRFEKIGTYRGLAVYSDYAHQPTEIKSTIEAAGRFYPQKKIFVIFQPHSYNRTENLFERFSQALRIADKVLILQTYKVAGREDDVEETDLAARLAREIGASAAYADNFNEAKQKIASMVKNDDILLCMGAGDIDVLARSLVEHDK